MSGRPAGLPASIDAGATLTVRERTLNRGAATAKPTVTRFLLSVDRRRSAGDVRLGGRLRVERLRSHKRSSGRARLTVPATVPERSFYLLACADFARRVEERREGDNCAASRGRLRVRAVPAAPVPTPEPLPMPTPQPPKPRRWELRNTTSPGPADIVFEFGTAAELPVTGDWDGDGVDTVGVFDPSTAGWKIRNSNTAGVPDATFAFGPTGATPLVGDWDGVGGDGVGAYDPATHVWTMRESASGGFAGYALLYELDPRALRGAGDWDATVGDSPGGVEPGGTVKLRNALSSGTPNITFSFPGAAVFGDWDGSGSDTIGSFDPATAEWGLRNTNSAGAPDIVVTYGNPGDTPVTGDWNGDGTDTLGASGAAP